MKNKIWQLLHYTDHTVEEDPYDAKLAPPLENPSDRWRYFDKERQSIRNPLYFFLMFKYLMHIDFVCNDHDWTIVSKRFVKSLGIDECEYYKSYRAVMIDSEIRSDDDPRISRDFGCADCIQYAIERPHLINEDYKVIFVTPLENAVNLEESGYEMDSSGEDFFSIDKLILNSRKDGYPPIFRIAEMPTDLFITQEAREKLKQAGITGPAYYPVDGSMWSREVDNPIIFPEIEA